MKITVSKNMYVNEASKYLPDRKVLRPRMIFVFIGVVTLIATNQKSRVEAVKNGETNTVFYMEHIFRLSHG